MTPGTWLVATTVLGRPVPVAGRYPHLCGMTTTATRSGNPYRYTGRNCAACAQQLDPRAGAG
ncbi:hypothetical protein [Micromonospora sp. RTGN7]|uniref:hypothetical protein n=1 Tax=Micromonospora sp. RTGN7 TaxID=3016526 RepID=UPI0029FF458B|nr:hypothetical protein [Micromonospora sp. RTGN7]